MSELNPDDVLTNKHFVDPGIYDKDGNLLATYGLSTHDGNYLHHSGGESPSIQATGNANNIDIIIQPKGTGSLNVNNSKISNLANPTSPNDAVNRSYIDTLRNQLIIDDGPIRTEDEKEVKLFCSSTTAGNVYFFDTMICAKTLDEKFYAAGIEVRSIWKNVGGKVINISIDKVYGRDPELKCDIVAKAEGSLVSIYAKGCANTIIEWRSRTRFNGV